MFRIKICGVTTEADARLVAESGADAVGLNFYPLSPRCIDERQAQEVAAALPPEVAKVGVFVNSSSAEIHTLVERLGLDLVQIHGDEPPQFLGELAGLRVIRAFRAQNDLEDIHLYLEQCAEMACLPAAVLIDAASAGQYGGTGQTANWQCLTELAGVLDGLPLVLAGGLTAANVAEAIATVRPMAVDTASGVEMAPGRKSPQLVAAFVAAARSGFAAQTL